MQPSEIQAVDVHGHYGDYYRDNAPPKVNDFATGDAETVVTRAKQVNIRATIVSPLSGLMPRGRSLSVIGANA